MTETCYDCATPLECFRTGSCDNVPVDRARSEPSARVRAAIDGGASVASGILDEAARIVGGDRNATHGDKERSFQVIANLWNAYLDGRKSGGPITPFDVAQFMVLLKIGRSIQGKAVRDHFVDQAGYSSIAGELAG